VKTQYGYHIVQVLQHEEARLRPYEEVKVELAAQIKKQRVGDQMQQIADKAQTALQKDPAHPEKVAADLNMQLVRADGVEQGKPVPQIGTLPDFDQSIAALKKGEVSAPVALPSDRVALAVVTDVIPPRASTFEEVQSQIKDTMVRQRGTQVVQKHAQELIDKAKAMGGDLEKAAKSIGLTVKTTGEVERTGTVEGLASASYLNEGFIKPAGAVFGPVSTPDGSLVAKVLQHVPADVTKLAAERDKIRDDLKSQKARDRASLFEAGLRDALTKQGTIKVHQNVINNLIAQYRPS